MDKKMHDKGLEVRKAVLGEAYVNNALKNVDSFNKPFQDLLNEYCWGSVWGREELPRKTRSMTGQKTSGTRSYLSRSGSRMKAFLLPLGAVGGASVP